MRAYHFGDLVAHAQDGIEGESGFLEYRRNLSAANGGQFLFREAEQFGSAKADGPAEHTSGRREETRERERDRRLAAPRFSKHARYGTGFDLEIDTLDGGGATVRYGQVAHCQERLLTQSRFLILIQMEINQNTNKMKRILPAAERLDEPCLPAGAGAHIIKA
jgi:hypothetical protein